MKTLSIRTMYAYFVVSGLKDVENRSWKIDYRGTLQIHSSGNQPFLWPDASLIPQSVQDGIQNDIDRQTPYDELSQYSRGFEDLCRYAEKVLDFSDKSSSEVSDKDFVAQLKDAFRHSNTEIAPFVNSAIIGSVELVDIVEDYDSPWAEPGQYHWILKNNVWYPTPELGVKGRLRLWEHP